MKKNKIVGKHYRIVHFYKRTHEINKQTLAGALANLEERRLNGATEVYSQLWEMSNETDGEMIGFFEDGAPAEIHVTKPTTAKLSR